MWYITSWFALIHIWSENIRINFFILRSRLKILCFISYIIWIRQIKFKKITNIIIIGVFSTSSKLLFLSNLIWSNGRDCDIAQPYTFFASTYKIFFLSSDFTYLCPITELIPPLILFSSNRIMSFSWGISFFCISIFQTPLPSITR